MSDILGILQELMANSSRLAKEAILKREINNEDLKEAFRLAYDPHIQFYIRKIPEYTKNKRTDSLATGMTRLNLLSSRTLTGSAGISHLALVLGCATANDAEVIRGIIAKDLRCGVNESTINKIWPGLIPEYPCMLASAYDEKLVEKVQFPALVQLKMDGMRFNAIVRGNKCEFRTRNGKYIDLLGELEADFVALAAGHDLVFDGELTVEDAHGMMDRKTGNGILNKAIKGTISLTEAQQVVATLWDEIDIAAFDAGTTDDHPYSFRLGCLKERIDQGFDRIRLVPTHEVTSIEAARELFSSYHAAGQEGIILKTMDGIWENKRSKNLIKFKGELECDLRVVDWEEGTGKNVGKLGALVLESGCGAVRVNVGTGFSDADRAAITRASSLGRIVAVKYNARISDKSGGPDSLFLPVFVEFRDDKDVADTAKDIK